MIKIKKRLILLIVIFIFGCDEKMPAATTQSSNQIHTEIGILNKLISLPKEPLSIKWELNESKKTGTGYLNVLLEFNDGDKAYILNNSEAFETQRNDKMEMKFYRDWLPEKAKNNIETKAHKDDYELVNINPLKPNLFNKTELSPYVNGSITPLSNGFIFISLYSM